MPSKQGALIEIAKGLQFDATAATQTFGVLARKRAGKTYLAGKLVEELHRVGCPVTVIDPVGNWWGLTLAANGKDPGLPFIVLGGEKGDMDLSPEAGSRLAELVVERRLSSVLDVSDFDDEQRARFVGDFLERFLVCSKRRRQVHMMVFEEVHLIAPERHKGFERALRRVEKVVRVGGNYGTGCMLLSQRPQSVNKEVLSQVECLFVGQLVESHGRKSIRDWVVEKGIDVKKRIDEAAALEAGEFFCWSPVWLQTFKKVKILPKWTFDASRTPTLGDGGGAAIERPKERLRGDELAALRAALAGPVTPASVAAASADVERERELRRAAEEGWRKASADAERLRERDAALRGVIGELHQRLGVLLKDEAPVGAVAAPPPVVRARAERPVGQRERPRTDDAERRTLNGHSQEAVRLQDTPRLDKCQRAILTVLAQQGRGLSKARLALMAGYSANSGGFNNALSKLRTRALIEGSGDAISATESGVREIGRVPPLPKGSALFDYWLQHPRLDKCSRAIVNALRESGRAVGKEELGGLTGYSPSSGGFNNALSKLRTLGLIGGRGAVELAEELRG